MTRKQGLNDDLKKNDSSEKPRYVLTIFLFADDEPEMRDFFLRTKKVKSTF